MSFFDVQTRLRNRGFNPGLIDGIWGKQTSNATRLFQRAEGLTETGLLDPKTLLALGLPQSLYRQNPDLIAPWMSEGKRRRGLHEARNNSRLWAWLRADGRSLGDPAKNPWCGDFAETCIALTLPDEPLPENPYLALNWTKFGITLNRAIYGAALTFHRGDPASWKGHIGFYTGEDKTHYHVLGGNQDNSISVDRIAKDRLRPEGIRWPRTVRHMTEPVMLSAAGVPVSTNEA